MGMEPNGQYTQIMFGLIRSSSGLDFVTARQNVRTQMIVWSLHYRQTGINGVNSG